MNEQQANRLFEQAIGALQSGQAAEAERTLKKLDNAIPSNPGIIYYLGVAASLQGRKEQAINIYDRVIRLHPQFVEAYNNKGLDLNSLGRHQEASEQFKKAIQIRSDFVEAYQNLGVAFNSLCRYEDAVTQFLSVLRFRPNSSDALTSMGRSLAELNRHDEALSALFKAIEINPVDAKAFKNIGRLYSDAKLYDKSIDAYSKALAIDSDLEWTMGDFMHVQTKICDWRGYDQSVKNLARLIETGKKSTSPFPSLGFFDSAILQRKASEIYISHKYPIWRQKRMHSPKKPRTRVGYISGDFGDHAVAYLMSGVIESHDRSRVEVYGFDIGNLGQSAARTRIVSAFDKHYELSTLSDPQAIELIRGLQIDIIVDLTGHTKGARTTILANCPAPIQVNYLGYPGTMGAPYIDYIIGDSTLIPKELQHGYTEKIAYLPDCFQANDSSRTIAPAQTRASFGLDESSFVYGCFNQCVKFTPEVFSVWLSILKQVPNSVLWLIEESELQVQNLRKFAEENGVSSHRLIFTGKLPYAEHLARYALMDVALDTMPFNGGTTTSDALWGCAPVLTCIGETFAGRMTASLLNAIGLPELITQSLGEYESLAVELGTNPEKLAAIQKKLRDNRSMTPLFNTVRFTRNLENAYEKMLARHQEGLPPDHIYVPHS